MSLGRNKVIRKQNQSASECLSFFTISTTLLNHYVPPCIRYFFFLFLSLFFACYHTISSIFSSFCVLIALATSVLGTTFGVSIAFSLEASTKCSKKEYQCFGLTNLGPEIITKRESNLVSMPAG